MIVGYEFAMCERKHQIACFASETKVTICGNSRNCQNNCKTVSDNFKSTHYRMRTPFQLAAMLAALALTPLLHAAEPEYKSELFKSTKLVYEDDFKGTTINKDFWEVRQNTTWAIKDGVLSGSPSSKEFQEKKKASADPSHAGLKPVMWLKQVPENYVCVMRVRYDAKNYQKGFPLFDLGHHIHTISFSEKETKLTIKKNVETLTVDAPLFALNEWHDVVIELKKGTILLKVDGKKHIFKSANIDGAGQHQIDFKAVDFGTCQIDHIKLWEGQP